MASILTPYLSFDGRAREAMEFYRSIFGGELVINTFGEFGMTDGPTADRIMHAQLETEQGYTLMGADTMPETSFRPGDTVTVCLSGDDAVLRDYFAKLAEGGTVSTPLEMQMWGDEYGSLTDKFGVLWMVNYTPPAEAGDAG